MGFGSRRLNFEDQREFSLVQERDLYLFLKLLREIASGLKACKVQENFLQHVFL